MHTETPGGAPRDAGARERLLRQGGRALVERLATSFLERTPTRLAAARAAHERGDLAAVEGALHELKTSVLMVGCTAMGRLCQEGIEAALARRSDQVARLLDALDEEHRAARPFVADFLEARVP